MRRQGGWGQVRLGEIWLEVSVAAPSTRGTDRATGCTHVEVFTLNDQMAHTSILYREKVHIIMRKLY